MLKTSSRWLRKGELRIPSCIHLHNTTSSLKFVDTFAFGAPKLIGHFAAIWMISYGEMVIISGMKSKLCISSLLYCSHIGRHGSMLFLYNPKREKDTISVARYIWGHKNKRPNSHTFPVACPSCHTLQPWNRPNSSAVETGASLTLRCKGYDPTGLTKCEQKYTIASRPPSSPLDSPYVGTWFSCAYEEAVVSTDHKLEASSSKDLGGVRG